MMCSHSEAWGDQYAGGIDNCHRYAVGGTDRCHEHGGSLIAANAKLGRLEEVMNLIATPAGLPAGHKRFVAVALKSGEYRCADTDAAAIEAVRAVASDGPIYLFETGSGRLATYVFRRPSS